jgi:predicted nucleotidyltransferase
VTGLEAALRRLVERLAAAQVAFAVVGGLAVSSRTEPRFTRDADLCVSVEDDRQAESLIQRLRDDGYAIRALVEQDAAGRIATVRLGRPQAEPEDVVLVLLLASSGIEGEVVTGAESLELFDGLSVPVATVPALIALKLLARDDVRRPQDRMDLVALMGVASATDLAEARRLAALIAERGYARGRDLSAALDALERELSDG